MAAASSRARGKLPETVADPARPSAFQPYTGAKKLVIKNLRASSSAASNAKAEEYYSRTHRDLEASLEAVWASGKPAVALEKLYRGVEDLCRKGDAKKIYDMLKVRMEAHVSKVILPRVERSGRNSNAETAKSLLAEWHAWNSQMVCRNGRMTFLLLTGICAGAHPVDICLPRSDVSPPRETPVHQRPDHLILQENGLPIPGSTLFVLHRQEVDIGNV